jgi:regulator of protease activity HflC (stomatin/prohibitin superfamily)
MKRSFIEENRMTLIIFLLIVLFIMIYLAPSIFIFVNAGQAGVLFRRFFGGVVTTNVYGEGLQIISPWNKMTIYDIRVQQIPIEYDVLTKNGLRVKVKLSIRFHPKYDTVAVLHQKIGPDYINKIVIPVAESSVRSIVGEKTAQDLFSLRGDVIYAINNKAELGLNQNFIALDEILVRDVVLPVSIQNAIERKEINKETYEAYAYILKREKEETLRKEIEAFGWKNYNDTLSQSLNGKVLKWMGIQATTKLAESRNAKVVIVGSGGSGGLPIILGSEFTKDDDRKAPAPGNQSPESEFRHMEPMVTMDKNLKNIDNTILNLMRFNNPSKPGQIQKTDEKKPVKSAEPAPVPTPRPTGDTGASSTQGPAHDASTGEPHR